MEDKKFGIGYAQACDLMLNEFHLEQFRWSQIDEMLISEEFAVFSGNIRKKLYLWRDNRAAAGLIFCYALACRMSELNWAIQNQNEFLNDGVLFCKKQKVYRQISLNDGWKEVFAVFFDRFYGYLWFSSNELSRFVARYFQELKAALGNNHLSSSHAFRHLAVATICNHRDVSESAVVNWVQWQSSITIATYKSMLENFTRKEQLL